MALLKSGFSLGFWWWQNSCKDRDEHHRVMVAAGKAKKCLAQANVADLT